MVEETFIKTIEKHALLKKRERVMLGVSGGPDSMCMLHLFHRLQPVYKLNITVAHFNHCLRKEADKEEEFVKREAERLAMRCISVRKKVDEGVVDSLEQTARNHRFDFFLGTARTYKIKKLALAHTKDDLAETVLMRILRGSGLLGISSFGVSSKFRGMAVIRPLIEVEKKAILQFLEQLRIGFCTDTSNFEERFLRNKIRLSLIPSLEKEYNPSLKNVLVTLAKTASLDYDFIAEQAGALYRRLRRKEGSQCISFEIEALQKAHPALKQLMIRLGIEEMKGSLRRIEFKHMEDILDLIEHPGQESLLDLPDILVEKYKGRLYLKSFHSDRSGNF